MSTKRQKVIHELSTILRNSPLRDEFDWQKDPLGQRYEVNKHCLKIEPEDLYNGNRRFEVLRALHEELIIRLQLNGWVLSSDTQFGHRELQKDDRCITLDKIHNTPEGFPLTNRISVR